MLLTPLASFQNKKHIGFMKIKKNDFSEKEKNFF